MIPLPYDVMNWLRKVFYDANYAASSKLTMNPNCHEPFIDFSLIESLQRISIPHKFKSDWLVSIDTHWLGNAPLWRMHDPDFGWREWEIADIGIVVMFRTANKLVRSKVGLLQSKRLYANNHRPETAEEIERYYRRGFGRLHVADEQFAEMTKPHMFKFTDKSKYVALNKGNGQWQAIESYERSTEVPVYYLLYNPLQMPYMTAVPRTDETPLPAHLTAGCRVVPSKQMRELLEKSELGESPSYGKISKNIPMFKDAPYIGGWSLEHFVVDLLLQCKTGRITDIRNDEGLYRVFYRRNAPIQAAIGISINAPEGFDWAVEPDQN